MVKKACYRSYFQLDPQQRWNVFYNSGYDVIYAEFIQNYVTL